MIKQNILQKEMICPKCEESFNLQEKLSIVLSCGDNICQKCCKKEGNHQKMILNCPYCQSNINQSLQNLIPNEQIVKQLRKNQKIICSIHDKQIRFLCKKDKKFYCEKCLQEHEIDQNNLIEIDNQQFEDDMNIIKRHYIELINFYQEQEKLIENQFDDDQVLSDNIQLIVNIIKDSEIDLEKLQIFKYISNQQETKQQIIMKNNILQQQIENLQQNLPQKELDQFKEQYDLRIQEIQNCLQTINQMNQIKPYEIIQLNSSLINYQYLNNLKNWLQDENLKLDQIYKGSIDGYNADGFHLKCYDKGKTITIIQSEYGQIFGGYDDQSFHNYSEIIEEGKEKRKSFLFSFTKQSKHNCIDQKAVIYGDNDELINFGGTDLVIASDCNINSDSMSQLGYDYELPFGIIKNSEDAQKYLAGSFFFKVIDIEVYRVLN